MADLQPDPIYPELFRAHGISVAPAYELGAVMVSTAMERIGRITVYLDPFQTRDLYNALRPLVEGYAPIGPTED